MSTGAAFGEGVYLARDVAVARNFIKTSPKIWPLSRWYSNDKIISLGCVAACRVICHPDNVSTNRAEKDTYFVVKNEHHIRLVAILVYKTERQRSSLSIPAVTLGIVIMLMYYLFFYLLEPKTYPLSPLLNELSRVRRYLTLHVGAAVDHIPVLLQVLEEGPFMMYPVLHL